MKKVDVLARIRSERLIAPVSADVGENLADCARADLAKVFPGDLFGPAYLRQLQQQFPAVEMIPIGGVTPSTVVEFIRVGVIAAMAGSSLVEPGALAQKNWLAITARARLFTQAVAAVIVS